MSSDLEAELNNYRAHRFGIIRLEDGEFALFDPGGTLIAVGSLTELDTLILTGPEHYETCIAQWITRLRKADITEGNRLLEQLGLALSTPAAAPALLRRI